MRMLKFRTGLSLIIAISSIIIFTQCADDNVTNSDIESAVIQIISGNNQTGTAGEALPETVVIQVINSSGEPIGNIEVEVEIVEGNGELSNTTPTFTTNQDGLIELEWIIGADYNALQLKLNADYNPLYVYAATANPAGLNETRTLSSLTKINDALYEITFYGDHTERAESMNRRFINYYNGASADIESPGFNCSVFTTHGDMGNILYGRSFDNPQSMGRCLTLICRYNSPGCYASLVPTRTRELGELYDPPNDLTELPLELRTGLLDAPFFSPDGINEAGLVVALADISSRSYTPDPAKEYIYKTMLIREILDHAATVDEAAEIALSHNLFDYGLSTFSTHALVADAAGNSILIELADREIRIIESTEEFQVATNSPLYEKTVSEARSQCGRYQYIYDRLSNAGGYMSTTEGMDILQTVGYEFTQWSIVYDITNRAVNLALDYDFNEFFNFDFNSTQ